MSSLIWVFVFAIAGQVASHGWLDLPVARSSAWLYNKKYDSSFPYFYQDTQMNCGEYDTFVQNGYKCSICGENILTVPKRFEKGGDMYVGKIVETYIQGQNILATVHITANHLGYFEFYICNVDGMAGDATKECLEQTILKDPYGNSRFHITVPQSVSPVMNTTLVLPSNLVCSHCVFQWKWKTGHRWNTDVTTGQSCIGCGEQEEFYGCSDIRILSSGNTQQTSIKPTDVTNPTTIKPTSATNPTTVKPTATTDGSVPIYGQCGGINYNGPTRCNQGLTCFKQTDYYSQCLSGDCPFTWACQENNKPLQTVKLYGQCGGASFNGLSNCEKGSYCSKRSSLFWQCVYDGL